MTTVFDKKKLKRAIRLSKYKIELLEKKRYRSQAALVEAIMTHTPPDDDDVEYFNRYTGMIEEERAQLHHLMAQMAQRRS